jgi:sugar phosphate isomerase/epimerase
MIVGGLVSVTFRQLSVNDIIELVTSTELSAIEWGGDVHVPHGDIQCAVETRQKTEDAGLSVASYGSYYRVGHNEPVQYELILDTAVALNAPIVRVWAGKRNAEDADPDYWHQVVEDSQRIAQLTSKAGKKIAYEYHQNTLTNTLTSTLKLLKAVGHEAVTSYWQAPSTATPFAHAPPILADHAQTPLDPTRTHREQQSGTAGERASAGCPSATF